MTTQTRTRVSSNAEQSKFVDSLSYTFIDDLGQEQVQSLYDFDEEPAPDFPTEAAGAEKDVEAASEFMIAQRAAFSFFQLPTRVLWEQYQTPIRNQKDRNTCSAFAMVAAIEARYKRDFGLDLDLSEQFFWHCYKSTGLSHPKVYKYENQSSYWGGGNSHGIRQAVNFAIPLEQDCRYLDKTSMQAIRDQIPAAGQLVWKSDPAQNLVTQDEVDAFEYSPLYISDTARYRARYGVKSYVLFDTNTVRNTANLEGLLAWGREVIVDAKLKWKMNSGTGVREYDANVQGAAHVFLLVGYDRHEQVFYLKNSWGESEFIRVSYEFARNCFSRGSSVTVVTDPNQPTHKGRALGRWYMNHDGWKGDLIIRRFTNEQNEGTRLGHYRVASGTPKAVNGCAVHNGRGIQFVITDGPDTDPTSTNSQSFTLNLYSWDITQAAGDTSWRNIPFGAYMRRSNFQSRAGSNFTSAKWVGVWSMNHDGWKGIFKLNQVLPIPVVGTLVAGLPVFGSFVVGEYQANNGTPKPIVGQLDANHAHILRFTIPFSHDNNQPFVLHFHTWSEDLASGYTFWQGNRFGVVAFKE